MAEERVSGNLLREIRTDSRTGRAELPDAIVRQTDVLRRKLKSPRSAESFLMEIGFLTPSGKNPRKYGG